VRPQSSFASRFTAGRRVGLFYFPTLGNTRGRAYVSFLGPERQHDKISADRGRRGFVAGRNFASMAKNRGAAGTHRHPSHPAINETTPPRARGAVSPDTPETSRPANPYYRLSDQYYDYSDPYHGLFNFYAVPPYVPGYTYRHMRMPPR
jgi:hypothetical protein